YSYNPTEVPGQFSPAAMAIEAPDSAYPIGDNLKWASILPEKRGFIRLGPAGTPFSIALYHQLHCVNGIRYVYVAARDGLFKTPEDRSASIGHANHCFDVLRQSLLCKADTTLMPVGRSNATTIVRRSRNWSQVREFVRSNQGFWKGIPYSTEPHAKATDSASEFNIAKFCSHSPRRMG
ncbi:hypothetical protein FB451DRAFT_1047445, partial [Mycena latifolia]